MNPLIPALMAALSILPALAGAYPVAVKDDRGVELALDSRPQNVAALWPPAADLLAALGQPAAGVTTYEGKKPVYLGRAIEDAKDLGDIAAPNLELMAASSFDLSVGMTRYNAPFAEEIEKFSPFLTYSGADFDSSIASMTALGHAFGEDGKVAQMNRDFLKLIDDMAAQAPAEPREVLMIWSFQDTLFGYQDNLLAPDLISRLGAVNPLGRDWSATEPENAFVVLEIEDLLKLDPDVILIFVSHGGAIPFDPGYERLQAYRNDRIYSVGYQYSQPSGPIAREMVLREAAHLIWPETFVLPDMPDAARAVPMEFAR